MEEFTKAMEAMIASLTKKITNEIISADLIEKIAAKVAEKISVTAITTTSETHTTTTTTNEDGSSQPSGHYVWKDGTTSVNLGVGKPILYRNEDGELEPTHYVWFPQRHILLREEDSRIYAEADGFFLKDKTGRYFYIKIRNTSRLWKIPDLGRDEEFIINDAPTFITKEPVVDEAHPEDEEEVMEKKEEVKKEEKLPIPLPLPIPRHQIPEGFYPLKSDDFAEGLYAYSPMAQAVFDAVNGITTNERLVVFRADGTRRTFNFRFPGHMALIKAACIRGEEVAEPTTTTTEVESDEWRWLTADMFGDSMKHLPTGKYKIYRNGRLENCITGEFLKSFKATSGAFEYKMYRISDASLSTGEKGAPASRLSHGLSVRLEKLIWLAFKWDRRKTLPRNLKLRFIDGDMNNYDPDNIEAINI